MSNNPMRSRRNDDSASSFELLLDTMCNTFGGIVFIALLLTILSQSIEEIKSEPDSSDKSGSINQQNKPSNEHQSRLIKKIERVRQDIALKEQREQLENEIMENLKRIESEKRDIKVLAKKVDTLKQEIAKCEKLRKSERELRQPKLHIVDKSPVFIAIRHGRFYPITNISYSITNPESKAWGNSGRGYDSSDILVSEYNQITTIELLSGRGQVIEKGSEKSGKFQQAIFNINPTREFITFAVYADSFAEFNYVKEIFINRGFEYNWFIIKDKLSLVKGGGNVHAQ